MNRTEAVDLAERVGATFVGGAVSVLTVDGADIADLSLWQGAAVAGGAAVLSLVKTLTVQYLARRRADGGNAE
jgi:hypothetical protein